MGIGIGRGCQLARAAPLGLPDWSLGDARTDPGLESKLASSCLSRSARPIILGYVAVVAYRMGSFELCLYA